MVFDWLVFSPFESAFRFSKKYRARIRSSSHRAMKAKSGKCIGGFQKPQLQITDCSKRATQCAQPNQALNIPFPWLLACFFQFLSCCSETNSYYPVHAAWPAQLGRCISLSLAPSIQRALAADKH